MQLVSTLLGVTNVAPNEVLTARQNKGLRMQMHVNYEWCVEETDEHGDITDHYHGDTLDDVENKFPLNSNENLVLVWNEGNNVVGIIDRSWVYVKNGTLPTDFEIFSLSNVHHPCAKTILGSLIPAAISMVYQITVWNLNISFPTK